MKICPRVWFWQCPIVPIYVGECPFMSGHVQFCPDSVKWVCPRDLFQENCRKFKFISRKVWLIWINFSLKPRLEIRNSVQISLKWLKIFSLFGLKYFLYMRSGLLRHLHDSIVVSIPACHAGDRGSIPRRGVFFFKSDCVRYLDCTETQSVVSF